MSYDAYNTFANSVQAEMQQLSYEQQLGILTIVVAAMNQRKHQAPLMSYEEKMSLFNELTGCIKIDKQIDSKEEYLDYIDERYGNYE